MLNRRWPNPLCGPEMEEEGSRGALQALACCWHTHVLLLCTRASTGLAVCCRCCWHPVPSCSSSAQHASCHTPTLTQTPVHCTQSLCTPSSPYPKPPCTPLACPPPPNPRRNQKLVEAALTDLGYPGQPRIHTRAVAGAYLALRGEVIHMLELKRQVGVGCSSSSCCWWWLWWWCGLLVGWVQLGRRCGR